MNRSLHRNDEDLKEKDSVGPAKKRKWKIIRSGSGIEVEWENDLNILKLHSLIIKLYHESSETVQARLEENLIDVENDLTVCELTKVEAEVLLRKWRAITKELNSSKKKNRLKLYYREVKSTLNSYNDIGPEMTITSWANINGDEIIEDDPFIEKRVKLIIKYLNITSKWWEITSTRIEKSVNSCNRCGFLLDEIEGVRGLVECPKCYTVSSIMLKTIYEDGTNLVVNNAINKEYLLNLKKSIARYQGRQSINKIPPDYEEVLNEYFTSRSNLPGIEVRKIEENKSKWKIYSLKFLLSGMQAIGMSGAYKDISLLRHRYWGWPLPNIYDKENEIIEIFNILYPVVCMFQKKLSKRKSGPVLNLLLFHILDKVGCNPQPQDWKLLSTSSSRKSHALIYKKSYEHLGWDKPRVI